MRKVIALSTLAVCAWWGFHEDGFAGIMYGWMLWGFTCFVFFALKDMTISFVKFIDPAKPKNVNLTVYKGETIQGHPDIEGTWNNVDPTRPTDEDFAGLITVRLKGGQR